MPPPGLDKLKHIVVLMMENRSFDHMLGALKATDPRIDGLDGTQFNPDTTGAAAPAQPLPIPGPTRSGPDHHFPGVDLQDLQRRHDAESRRDHAGVREELFLAAQGREALAEDHVSLHAQQAPGADDAGDGVRVFNRWFASIPGPTLCNRAFAHYGSSFGHVGMEVFYPNTQFKSIYQRLDDAGKTAKIYYFDVKSSSLEVVNLLQHQPQFFGTFQQFLDDCGKSALPDYSFIEPNYSDHDSEDGGAILASDQHPDHHVQEGERFIAAVYNAIRQNAALWESTALLIVYDEHGGIYDHVPPPACTPDGFVAQPDATGTGKPFLFEPSRRPRPGRARVAVGRKGTVVGTGRVFEHASIPATATSFFLQQFADRSPREKAAETFLDLLTLNNMRTDAPEFDLG